MNALTEQQRRLLDFITAYSVANERSPSFDEMRQGLGLLSKSGVHRLVTGLEERGFIRRLYNKARAIEIVKEPHLPDEATLGGVSAVDLAKEAKRRGLVLGHIHRETFRVGEKFHEHRTFVEIRA